MSKSSLGRELAGWLDPNSCGDWSQIQKKTEKKVWDAYGR